MGNTSSSTVNQRYDSTIVNRSELNILNENINDFTSNIVMKNAADCSANISQMNIFDISGSIFDGDLNVNIDQGQNAAINFDCVQIAQFTNDIANGILDKMLSAMENSYSTDILEKIEANAKASQENGALSTSIGNTNESTANIDYSSTVVNENRKNIQNVLKNAITNNLNMENVQNCISNIKQSNQANFKSINVKGNAVLAIKQTQIADMVAKCIQQAEFGNKIVNQAAKDLGIAIDESSTTKKQTEVKTEASSEQKNQGLIDSIGNAVGSVLGGIGDIFGNIFGAMTGMIVMLSLICLFCVCSISLSSFMMISGKPGESGHAETLNTDQVGGFIDFNSPSSMSISSFSLDLTTTHY